MCPVRSETQFRSHGSNVLGACNSECLPLADCVEKLLLG
jgi:hypothetical protein